jgi:hypothetical protein
VFVSVDALPFMDARSTLWGWPGQNPFRYTDPSGHTWYDPNTWSDATQAYFLTGRAMNDTVTAIAGIEAGLATAGIADELGIPAALARLSLGEAGAGAAAAAGGAGAAAASSVAQQASNAAQQCQNAAIQFGNNANQVYHAFRHIDAMGLDRGDVMAAIEADLATAASQLQPGQPLNQVITVAGQQIQYTAYLLANGVINVGRIHGSP